MLGEGEAEHLDLGGVLGLVGLRMGAAWAAAACGLRPLSVPPGSWVLKRPKRAMVATLGLVWIIVLFVQGYRPNNPVHIGPGTAAGVRRTTGMRRGSPQRQGRNHLPPSWAAPRPAVRAAGRARKRLLAGGD